MEGEGHFTCLKHQQKQKHTGQATWLDLLLLPLFSGLSPKRGVCRAQHGQNTRARLHLSCCPLNAITFWQVKTLQRAVLEPEAACFSVASPTAEKCVAHSACGNNNHVCGVERAVSEQCCHSMKHQQNLVGLIAKHWMQQLSFVPSAASCAGSAKFQVL